MSETRDVLRAAVELAERGEGFVLMTVVSAKGSTPRDAGAKMVWSPALGASSALTRLADLAPSPAESGRGDQPDRTCKAKACVADQWIGTVGGGQFEHLVMADAERYLASGACGVERYVLGADADQCCGGVMEVFFEAHRPGARVVVFGAGHVSRELVRLLEPAGLDVVVVDDRAEWNAAERFPRARRVLSFEDGVRLACERGEETIALVMTCSHDTDFELLRDLLKRPPRFVGLIGSRSKRACLFGRLVASGAEEEIVKRVHCPIGVGDTGKEPALVAVSIAAQVLMEAKQVLRTDGASSMNGTARRAGAPG